MEALRVVSGEGTGWQGVEGGAGGIGNLGVEGGARAEGVEGAVEEGAGSAMGSDPPVEMGRDGEGGQEDKIERRIQAESVAEAVWRHQDVGEQGTITAIGACLQFATILGTFSISSSIGFHVERRPIRTHTHTQRCHVLPFTVHLPLNPYAHTST